MDVPPEITGQACYLQEIMKTVPWALIPTYAIDHSLSSRGGDIYTSLVRLGKEGGLNLSEFEDILCK